jgi:hypothetical protein
MSKVVEEVLSAIGTIRPVGETRSPRRVSTHVEEGPSAECPIGPGSTRPSPRSGVRRTRHELGARGTLWRQRRARPAAGATLRHPDLYGRAHRSSSTRGFARGRRPRDPQRGRPRERRRHSFSGHLLQAARNARMVRHSPHELRDGAVHERDHQRAAGQQPGNGEPRTGPVERHRRGPGSGEGEYIDWLTIKDLARSVVSDVARIKRHPLVPRAIPVYGYIYQVESGRLVEVSEATVAGRAG